MAKTGQQRYPGASTTYWYGSAFPGSAMEVNVIVWHSTEGTSLPSYGGGASAPNFTCKPDFTAKRLVWYQHFDFDVSSRALVNKAGGVATNTLNACQVEIVGTCDPATHAKWVKAGYAHLYTPQLPDWAIRDLAAFAKWANANHGVPLTSGVTFKAYPSSYGANGVRMSGAKWQSFEGHCGHQHVPENDHGDPGSMPMAAILTAAKGGTTPPKEEAVALTKADVKTLFTTDGVITVPADWSPGNDSWTAASLLIDSGKRLRALQRDVGVLSAANSKLVDAVATLAAGIGDLDPAAIVSELRAAIEAIDIRLDVPDTQ